ncbi:MAG TPA: 2-dehydro-3-deoxy-6-phosphogalactonate aldolase [Azospirillaceae bacterium]|nr:2-dehydro-3-deoxy-6-phosphogalactonate aldolase [Azospirillaceae bacterium]
MTPAPTTLAPTLADWLDRCPLIAILRGVRPAEILDIGGALAGAGFRIIEVPLNSPDPFDSIGRLAAAFPDVLVGAGTVRRAAEVDALVEAGGRLVVTPHADPAVITAAKRRGLIATPGVYTATEAFAAIDAGADGLKLFPAEVGGPDLLKALKAVLPPDVPVLPVGGVTPEGIARWRAAGARGFGIGGALYKPGDTADAVAVRARRFVEAATA